nr:transmembrane protein 81 isoform X3 [Pseudochaenichthys georgianus]
MQHVTVRFLLFFLLLLLHPVTSVDLEEVDKVSVEVIVDSSPCSATCGLGVKTQTLCLLKDGKKAMEEDVRSKDGTEVSEECRVRKLSCLESWQCGLRTMTVTLGERVEIDCLGEVMQAMGRFSWRVSWRYARGIISSDDTLFARWNAPLLERVVLDPVMEEDAAYALTSLGLWFWTSLQAWVQEVLERSTASCRRTRGIGVPEHGETASVIMLQISGTNSQK